MTFYTPLRLARALVFTGLLIAAIVLWWPTPSTPSDPPVPVAPSSFVLNPEAAISYYQDRIRKEPEKSTLYTGLAQVYLQQARETGREGDFLPKARQALDRALTLDPTSFHARALQASMMNTLHQFEAGKEMADALLARNDRMTFVHGIRVDALVELGDYPAAIEAADRMLSLRPNLAAYARAAYLRELHGDVDGAIRAMRLAADAGAWGRTDRAWTLYQLGLLYLQSNRPDTAAFIFKGILDERPGYAFALAGLGRVHLARAAYDEALDAFRKAYAVQPRPLFLEWMAETYRDAGDTVQANSLYDRVLASMEAARAWGENVDMEQADLLATLGRDLPRALALARHNYERRPRHLHSMETFAWALNQNNRPTEAVPLIEEVLSMNPADAMAQYRAGVIYLKAGLREKGRQALQSALHLHLERESRIAAADAVSLLGGSPPS